MVDRTATGALHDLEATCDQVELSDEVLATVALLIFDETVAIAAKMSGMCRCAARALVYDA